jgi:hypothetical protein
VFPTSANRENGPPPDCELNPLSNPLLAANLGRWAEVYFTSPPDQRAQAVAGLLRELELEASGNPQVSSPEISDGEAAALNAHLERALPPFQAADSLTPGRSMCAACGHSNPGGQSFCGMCGVELTSTPDETQQESAQPERMVEEQNIHGIFGPYYAREPQADLDAAAKEDDLVSSYIALNTKDSGLPSFAQQPEPAPYRHRLYVGVVLAILLGGLIYLGKRGEVFSDGQQSPDSKIIPAAQPSATAEGAQNTASKAPLPAAKLEEKESPPQPAPEAPRQPSATALHEQTLSKPAPQSTFVSAKAAGAASQRAIPQGQSGAENLAEAQRYLNGTAAGIRNTREAVPLLWDAVAKGNAPATLFLSDLYLRGDGVAQNCEQARLLLDMAAKKGVKGAGERLRNLQAFGCR